MYLKTAAIAIIHGVSLCFAQTISISGGVTDGSGIAGALVHLEKLNISATTDSNGFFTLKNIPIPLSTKTSAPEVNKGTSIRLSRNELEIFTPEKAPVSIGIFKMDGRRVFSANGVYGTGAHSVRIPQCASGIRICRVSVGSHACSFTAPSQGFNSKTAAGLYDHTGGNAPALSATAVADTDVICVTKDGYLTYREYVDLQAPAGKEMIIRMLPCAGIVRDVDGNEYQSVKIGDQVWTTENLKTTRFRDGTAIPLVTDAWAWRNLTTPGYCWYDNDSINKASSGALYNGYAVDGNKIAPEGWHVPADSEWTILENYLVINGYNWDGSADTATYNKVAKALAAKTGWPLSSTAGETGCDLSKNNSSGFSARPAGYRLLTNGFFGGRADIAYWWCASADDHSYAPLRGLTFTYQSLGKSSNGKALGFSIRLVRD